MGQINEMSQNEKNNNSSNYLAFGPWICPLAPGPLAFGPWPFGLWPFGLWPFGLWPFGPWPFGPWPFGVSPFGPRPFGPWLHYADESFIRPRPKDVFKTVCPWP